MFGQGLDFGGIAGSLPPYDINYLVVAGGGGGSGYSSYGARGGHGAVRIVWKTATKGTYGFPSTNVS